MKTLSKVQRSLTFAGEELLHSDDDMRLSSIQLRISNRLLYDFERNQEFTLL
jgi:hypothetical protein